MKQQKLSSLVNLVALFLTVVLAVQCTQTDSRHFHFKGILANAKDSITVSLVSIEKDNMQLHDTTIVLRDGAFDAMLPLEDISLMQVFNTSTRGNNNPEGLIIFAIPGEELTVEGRLGDSCRFGGSDFYRQYNDMAQIMLPFQRRIANLTHAYEQLAAKGTVPEEKMTELTRQEETIINQRTKAIFDFTKAHPDDEASVSFLLYLDEESAQKLIKVFSPKVRNGRFRKLIQAITSPQRETEDTQKSSKQEGTAAPDFTLHDIKGQSFTLSSLRGKYVVLDFWGSWCGWCIKGIPAMKDSYNKYKGKLEIVGIDCQDSEADWKKAVKDHAMPWIQVANGVGASDVARLYRVEGFPTKVIIDPAGKVLKVVVGEDPAFYDYLDQLFK